MDLIKRFLIEFLRWVYYGHKYRSKKRMMEIYSICEKCPHFVEDGGWLDDYDKCDICGCNIHPTKRTVNKIAWASTSCPDEPPLWVPEVGFKEADSSEESPF